MKKAEEYIPKVCAVEEILHSNSNKPFWSKEFILKIIKQTQIDTIRETAQACADNAATVHNEEFLNELSPGLKSNDLIYKPSILGVADKLIKELE